LKIFRRADDMRPPGVRLAFAISSLVLAVSLLGAAAIQQNGLSFRTVELTAIVVALGIVAFPVALLIDAWVTWPIVQKLIHGRRE